MHTFAQADKVLSVLQKRRELLQQRPGFTSRSAVEYSTAEDGEALQLLLYGVIGEDFWGDGVSALDVAVILAAHPNAKQITVRINSPGGDVFDAIAIYNSLVLHSAEVVCIVDGLAASAASVILQAGDRRTLCEGSKVMIHRAWTFAIGNAAELRAVGDILDMLDEDAAQMYANRSGLDVGEVKELLAGDGVSDGTWFTVDEAIAKGFADAPEEKPTPAQNKTYDFSQLGGLRIAALFPTSNGEETVPQSKDTDQPGDGDQPRAATFPELKQLAGDDHGFICAQQEAGSTLAEATAAFVEHLQQQNATAREQLADVTKQRDDLQAAAQVAEADTEENALSGSAAGDAAGDPAPKSKTFRDKIRMPK